MSIFELLKQSIRWLPAENCLDIPGILDGLRPDTVADRL